MTDPIITLTTDFGTSDHLVGTMKGVILNINPAARLVDLQHHVAPFDVLDGALTIGAAWQYFPPRTIHLVVVDPGVGTDRRPLLVTAAQHYFIAPDNGVLSMVYERDPDATVRQITASHNFLDPVSPTFHGGELASGGGEFEVHFAAASHTQRSRGVALVDGDFQKSARTD